MAEGCSDESAPIDALLYDLEHKDPAWMIQNSYKTSGKGVMNVDKPLISTSPQAQGFVPNSQAFLPCQGSSTGNTWADFTRMGIEQQCLTFVPGHVSCWVWDFGFRLRIDGMKALQHCKSVKHSSFELQVCNRGPVATLLHRNTPGIL